MGADGAEVEAGAVEGRETKAELYSDSHVLVSASVKKGMGFECSLEGLIIFTFSGTALAALFTNAEVYSEVVGTVSGDSHTKLAGTCVVL